MLIELLVVAFLGFGFYLAFRHASGNARLIVVLATLAIVLMLYLVAALNQPDPGVRTVVDGERVETARDTAKVATEQADEIAEEKAEILERDGEKLHEIAGVLVQVSAEEQTKLCEKLRKVFAGPNNRVRLYLDELPVTPRRRAIADLHECVQCLHNDLVAVCQSAIQAYEDAD